MNAFPTQDTPAASRDRDADELRLIEAAQRGDKDAMDRLTERYMPLLKKVSRQFNYCFRHRPDWCECLGDAWEAFRKLVRTFKPDAGCPFPTFISRFLWLRMIDSLDADDDRLIYVPHPQRKEPEKVTSLSRIVQSDDNKSVKLGDLIEDRNAPQPNAERGLNGFTDGLRMDQRIVLLLYYVDDRSMKQIGESLGLSQSRISYIHQDTIAELRKRYDARQRGERGELTTTQDKGD